MQGRWPKGTR